MAAAYAELIARAGAGADVHRDKCELLRLRLRPNSPGAKDTIGDAASWACLAAPAVRLPGGGR
jgi:hypothetical protein